MDSGLIKKNDVVTIDIEDIGSDGEGIGRYQGFALFVRGAVTGDVAEVLVLKVKKSYGYGKVLNIIKRSPHRVEPRCNIADRCGGCQLQHISYDMQLAYKQNKVVNCLKRIGGISDYTLEPIIGMEDPYHYRNKAQFPVSRDKYGNVLIGFYAEHTHSVINTDQCHIQPGIVDKVVGKMRTFIQHENVSVYDEELHKGLVRHVLVRVGFRTGDVMVCLVVNGHYIDGNVYEGNKKHNINIDNLINKLIEIDIEQDFYKVKSICINQNTEKTNVILGGRITPIYGDAYINEYVGDVKYRISPLSFFQVNPVQMARLYDKVLEYAELTGNEVVWDLYCGIGTISLYLAKMSKMVYGVEVVRQAIEDARENAGINGITNVEFIEGTAEEVMLGTHVHADIIIVDPPRKGCYEALLRTMAEINPNKIIYISCDPAALARDAKYLCEMGYRMDKVAMIDQFGQSVHVETVCRMTYMS